MRLKYVIDHGQCGKAEIFAKRKAGKKIGEHIIIIMKALGHRLVGMTRQKNCDMHLRWFLSIRRARLSAALKCQPKTTYDPKTTYNPKKASDLAALYLS